MQSASTNLGTDQVCGRRFPNWLVISKQHIGVCCSCRHQLVLCIGIGLVRGPAFRRERLNAVQRLRMQSVANRRAANVSDEKKRK